VSCQVAGPRISVQKLGFRTNPTRGLADEHVLDSCDREIIKEVMSCGRCDS
jgi:hypothetical protein